MSQSTEFLYLTPVTIDDSNTPGTSSPFLGPLKKNKRQRPCTWRYPMQLITSAAHQAWHNLRTTRWGLLGLCVLYMCLLAGVFTGLLFLIFYDGVSTDAGCKPDGSFSPYTGEYNWWAPSGFYEITLTLGPSLKFVEVKMLDVAWQVIVGRGRQALVSFLTWRVFTDYVAVKMTEVSVTYLTFWIIFLHQEATFMSIYRLASEFCIYTGTGSPLASTFILLTIAFALAFPTFVNSMTGYATDSGPFIEVETGTMIPFSKFAKVAYIIHDGARVGLSDEYNVVDGSRDPWIRRDSVWHSHFPCSEKDMEQDCAILSAVSNYVSQYGFYGREDKETKWMDRPTGKPFNSDEATVELNMTTLPAPALNISGFYFHKAEDDLFGYNWTDPNTGKAPFQNVNNQKYVYEGQLYSVDEIQELGDCKALSSQEYQWGFSCIQLVIMLITLAIWSTGLYIMWHHARHRLPLQNEPEVPRGWRAMIELSRAIERELSRQGIDLTTMEDRQVKREIRKHLRGGAISLEARLTNPNYRTWPNFLAWMRKEMWWVLTWLCIMGASFLLVMFTLPVPAIILGTAGGSFFAVVWIGTTGGSRAFMLVVITLVGIAISIPTVVRY